MKNNYSDMSASQLYSWLRKSYDSNELYDDLSQVLLRTGTEFENIKALANPTQRSVEFFVSKILVGDSINVTSDNQAIVDSIQQIYEWSNFVGKKSAYIRDYALLGDLFLKVRNTEDKVIVENINPTYVTSVNQDMRGNITQLRLDIPYITEDGKSYWYTEYWDKGDGANGYVSVWEHTMSPEAALDQLGDPMMYNPLLAYGIDFLPIVHVMFRDVNSQRGRSCVYHALSKIDEANRIMTRLHEQIFVGSNRAWFVDISNKQGGKATLPMGLSKNQKDGAIVEINGSPQSAVPQLPYGDLLNVVNNMGEELIRDLPELREYSISEVSGLSGKSISLLMQPAFERASEAEANLINGLIRVNYIGLTLGIANQIFPSSLGQYIRGDFKHEIVASDMNITPIDEKAASLNALTSAGIPLEQSMRLAGFSEDDIEKTKETVAAQPVSQPVIDTSLPVSTP